MEAVRGARQGKDESQQSRVFAQSNLLFPIITQNEGLVNIAPRLKVTSAK